MNFSSKGSYGGKPPRGIVERAGRFAVTIFPKSRAEISKGEESTSGKQGERTAIIHKKSEPISREEIQWGGKYGAECTSEQFPV